MSLPGACRGSNSLQFNSIASITNSIQFPASGARNMGEVRNHTSLYFSLYSLYLAYRDGRWDERRYFRRCTILPATSASNICQASIVCQQHLSASPASASNICRGQRHLPASSADICCSPQSLRSRRGEPEVPSIRSIWDDLRRDGQQ